MKEFSFLFAGTSPFAKDCLEILLKTPNLKLKALISQADKKKGRGLKLLSSPVSEFAKKNNLPLLTPKNINSEDSLQKLKHFNADFLFVCAYGQILSPKVLSLFPKKALNLHLSLLPLLRGAAPVERALMEGMKKTGCSLQIMTKDLDAGDIIGSRSFEIKEEDQALDIFKKSFEVSKDLIKKDLIEHLRGEKKALPQDEALKTYAKKLEKKEAKINWEKPALDIHNQIRALHMRPGAFSFLGKKRLKILKAKVVEEDFKDFLPGEICFEKEEKLFVKCGRYALELLELQLEGKKKQKVEDFLNSGLVKLKDKLS